MAADDKYERYYTEKLWAMLPDIENEQARLVASRYTFRLVHLADILAVTTSAE